MNIANINVIRAITHEVVRASQLEERPPVLSDDILTFDAKGNDLISRRLTAAVASGSHCVDVTVADDTRGSPFDHVVSMIEQDSDEFILNSKHLANSLSLAQTTGSIKSGTAIFIQGTCVADGRELRFIAVIKADSDQGFYKKIDEDNHITLTYINDMLLGESQRLIKIGFFLEEEKPNPTASHKNERKPEEFSIKIFDHTLQNSGDGNAARYFYGIFLKCRQADNSARKTKEFFEVARGYIDNLSIPREEKVDLRGDLISYMRGNKAVIEPRTFAQDVLPINYQDDFLNKCSESKITDAFTKDTGLIKSKLKRQSIKFTSEVIMYASPEIFRESVKIGQENDGWTEVKIKGLIE